MFDPSVYFRAVTIWQKAAFDYSQMCFHASQVIWQRSAEMALGTMSTREATRMFFEKPVAFARSAEKAAKAGVSGKGFAGATAAAIGPYRTKTKSNARRLARKK